MEVKRWEDIVERPKTEKSIGDFKFIIVTGPARSGTHLAAAVISQYTNREWMDESAGWQAHPILPCFEYLAPWNWTERMRAHMADREQKPIHKIKIIQGADIAPFVHWDCFGGRDDVAIVFLHRDLEEIRTSWDTIPGMTEEPKYDSAGIPVYGGWIPRMLLDYMGHTHAPVYEYPKLEYEFWKVYQRSRVKHPFDIEYHSLESHPLWKPQDVRNDLREAGLWRPDSVTV